MVKKNRNGLEIDVQKLLVAYLHKLWLIAVCGLIAAVISGYYTHYFVTPLYRSSVTVYVNNTRNAEQVNSISSSNLATAQRLVNTYINIIISDVVLEKVADACEFDISPEAIRSAMSASQVDDTELFKVVITDSDPDKAAQIANAVAEVAPKEIAGFVEGSSAKILDYAKVAQNPFDPVLSRNCALGALIGCAVALAFVTLSFLVDVRIRNGDDLSEMFDIPVLVQIPVFAPNSRKRLDPCGEEGRKGGEE